MNEFPIQRRKEWNCWIYTSGTVSQDQFDAFLWAWNLLFFWPVYFAKIWYWLLVFVEFVAMAVVGNSLGSNFQWLELLISLWEHLRLPSNYDSEGETHVVFIPAFQLIEINGYGALQAQDPRQRWRLRDDTPENECSRRDKETWLVISAVLLALIFTINITSFVSLVLRKLSRMVPILVVE